MKKLKITYLLLGLLGLSFNNASAISGNEHTAPGSICSAYYGKDHQSARAYGDTQLTVDKGMWIKCPIIEDEMKTGEFRVDVNLYHPSDRNTKCRLRKAKKDGTAVQQTKSINGAGHKTISFNVSSYKSQNTSVTCHLDKHTRLMNLWWIER